MTESHPRHSQYPKIELAEARQILRNIALEMSKSEETVDLFKKLHEEDDCVKIQELVRIELLGRIISEEVRSLENIPPTRVSTKDGYAVIAQDGIGQRKVVGVCLAGAIYQETLKQGDCVRISTGGVIPDGADAVVMREYTERKSTDQSGNEQEIIVNRAVAPGDNIRLPGSDIRVDSVIVPKGAQIGSAELGILCAAGIKTVRVYKKSVVTVFSTGNELVSPTVSAIPFSKVRDSNGAQLYALFREHGFESRDGGRISDDKESLKKKLKENLELSNVIVTTGGVSMGEQDYMKDILKELGFTIVFGRINMKPGLPCTMGTRRSSTDQKLQVVLALPGNPASAWVCAHIFAVPLLRAMSGQRINHSKINVRLEGGISLGDRPEFVRARILHNDNDAIDYPVAQVTDNQVSSNIGSLVGADVLLELNAATLEKRTIEKNELVTALIVSPKFCF